MIGAVVLFLALLTVAAQLATVAVVALLVGPRGPGMAARLRAEIAPQALGLAALVAAVAMGGSLFFSEVAGFLPCTLCWYQRIAMYPLVPILGLAAWRGDAGVRPYALVLAGLGLALSGYHYLLQQVPALQTGACDPRAPCTMRWVWQFGYISIPLMAATAFALIGALLGLAGRQETGHRNEAAEGSDEFPEG